MALRRTSASNFKELANGSNHVTISQVRRVRSKCRRDDAPKEIVVEGADQPRKPESHY